MTSTHEPNLPFVYSIFGVLFKIKVKIKLPEIFTFMMVLALRDSLTVLDGREGLGSPALLVASSTIT